MAVLTLLLASCSASGTGSVSSGGKGTIAGSTGDSAAGPSPSASPVQVARQQATAAYVGMWHDMAVAGRTSDWNSPTLAQFATGDALSVISRSLYADHLNGLVTKGEPKNFPRVTSAKPATSPLTVMISDCGDSTHWLKYRKDNGQLADEGGGRRAITAEVKKQAPGSWKVTRFAVEGLGSC
ncbi:hypothetical protein [Streptomyces hokutonensis]|uniref:hypothetical protein n=1 Tax=Streptomyces hokutonensis TaxID=1306990 RepID=UPI003829C28D